MPPAALCWCFCQRTTAHRCHRKTGKPPGHGAGRRIIRQGRYEAIVKAGVVGNKDLSLQLLLQLISNIGKQRRISHHRIRDASEPFDKAGNSGLRVQQGLPFPHHLTGSPEPDTDFRNPVSLRVSAGGFGYPGKRRFLAARDCFWLSSWTVRRSPNFGLAHWHSSCKYQIASR